MPVQNSQFLKGEQVPSVSAKNLAIKNYAICTETSYLRFSEKGMQISNASKLTFLQYWREFDLLGRNPS